MASNRSIDGITGGGKQMVRSMYGKKFRLLSNALIADKEDNFRKHDTVETLLQEEIALDAAIKQKFDAMTSNEWEKHNDIDHALIGSTLRWHVDDIEQELLAYDTSEDEA